MAAAAAKTGKGGKPSPKKAGKKRRRGKKGPRASVISAFVAGLLLAGTGVLLLHHFFVGDAAGPPASPPAVSMPGPEAPVRPGYKRAVEGENTRRAVSPSPADRTDVQEPVDPVAEESVAAALADLRNLPFEKADAPDAVSPPAVPAVPDAPDMPGPEAETPNTATPSRGTAAYPVPVERASEARLCIVMDDLGAKRQPVQFLLALDYPVTLAFWPHGVYTREGAEAAAAAGREVLVHQPMEPVGYPGVRPGPDALLVGMDPDRIRAVLASSLAAVPHASGLNNHMGSRFTRSVAGVDAVIGFLRERKLFMLDSVTHPGSVFAAEGGRLGLEHYSRDVFLDVVRSRTAVLEALHKAEGLALRNGKAVAIGHPLPETLEALQHFERTRNKNIRIVRLRDLNR
jgi:polysaccharide deacetylase 2 family uncharacterized protein YibQ